MPELRPVLEDGPCDEGRLQAAASRLKARLANVGLREPRFARHSMPNVRVPPGRANHADATKLIQFVPSPAASGRLDLLGVNSTQEDIGFLLTSWVLMSAWFAKVICCHATRRPLPGNCSLASAGQRAAASRTPLRLVACRASLGSCLRLRLRLTPRSACCPLTAIR